MSREETHFQHQQREFKHHYHQPSQMHDYLDLSLQLQKHYLHSVYQNMDISFGFEFSSSFSLSTPSTKTDLNISPLAQMPKHLIVCFNETTSRPERRKCHLQPAQRRHAANMRERRRMQSITCAFEGI